MYMYVCDYVFVCIYNQLRQLMNSVIAVLSSRCTRTTIIYTYVYIIYDIYTYVYTCCTHNNTHIHTHNCSCLLSTVVGRAVVGCWPSASLFAVDDCVADMLDFAFCPNRRLLQLTCYTHTYHYTIHVYLFAHFFFICVPIFKCKLPVDYCFCCFCSWQNAFLID